MQDENIIYRKVNRGYQVTLPPEFREKFNLDIGSTISMSLEDNKLVIEPYIDQKTYSLKKVRTIFEELDKLPKLEDSEDELFDILDKERKSARKKKNK
ncbi:MAG: Antidote-toxin recognition MazE, bacterial antitoxin [Rickettsiaceae bacterium]|nr:Antidote-toxin recognition MazE, bacterial antitoxin [Rickettsiaceae bacterium]